jgi:hypothetical protein
LAVAPTMTARMNVTLPDELAELVRREMPGLNVSAVLQRALSDLIECRHDALVCACCGAKVQHRELVDVRLGAFYQEAMWQLHAPIARCETAEGAARVLQSLARSWEVPTVDATPLPRPTRSQRARVHADLVKEAEAATAELFESGAKPRRRARTA